MKLLTVVARASLTGVSLLIDLTQHQTASNKISRAQPV